MLGPRQTYNGSLGPTLRGPQIRKKSTALVNQTLISPTFPSNQEHTKLIKHEQSKISHIIILNIIYLDDENISWSYIYTPPSPLKPLYSISAFFLLSVSRASTVHFVCLFHLPFFSSFSPLKHVILSFLTLPFTFLSFSSLKV